MTPSGFRSLVAPYRPLPDTEEKLDLLASVALEHDDRLTVAENRIYALERMYQEMINNAENKAGKGEYEHTIWSNLDTVYTGALLLPAVLCGRLVGL